MKRARGKDQLTGGTGDVNPQSITVPVIVQTAADATTIVRVPLPIPRLPTRPGYNLVVELLDVEFSFPWNAAGIAVGVQGIYTYISTSGETPPSIEQAMLGTRIIADTFFQWVFAAGGTMDSFLPDRDIDLTDEAGHGRLVASDNIYVGLMSYNTNNTNHMCCRLWYRWKEVSLVEYIGIVQSEQ